MKAILRIAFVLWTFSPICAQDNASLSESLEGSWKGEATSLEFKDRQKSMPGASATRNGATGERRPLPSGGKRELQKVHARSRPLGFWLRNKVLDHQQIGSAAIAEVLTVFHDQSDRSN
jgi:hypothetical protein